MRLARILLFLLLCLPALAQERVTVSLTVTNGTTNGMTWVLNGSTRTFTNNVQVSSVQVLTNSTHTGTKTNLYNQIALNPFSQVTMLNAGASNITFVGASGLAMAASISGTPEWGFVTYSTQTVSSLVAVRIPISGEPTAAARTNIASGLVAGIESFGTNSLDQNSVAASELMGLTNTQVITGQKYFSGQTTVSNQAGHLYVGAVTGTNFSGVVGVVTNGLFKTNIFDTPATSNLVNYGSAIISVGSGSGSQQFGDGAISSGISSLAVGVDANASGDGATALGNLTAAAGEAGIAIGVLASAGGSGAIAIGPSAGAAYDGSVAIGNTGASQANQIKLGGSGHYVLIAGNLHVEGSSTNNTMRGTNVFPVGADISFGRYALTTLANGANSIQVGTNVFVHVSGPSGAFTINGIDGQPNRDGKFLILLNLTAQNMTIAHDSGTEPTAANRIYTMTGADHATTGNGAAMLIYSASASRWILLNLQE